jgi:GntR family transcriptional regulator/MocR family aminotransferase
LFTINKFKSFNKGSDNVIIIHNISKDNEIPLYIQIYEYFKDSIIAEDLKVGEKLPSIRKLSSDLGVSTTTIENAYLQLEIEGFIKGIPRKGLFVEKIEKISSSSHTVEEVKIDESRFFNMNADREAFDFKLWQKHLTKTINEMQPELLSTPSVNGSVDLRKEIAKYSRELRGANCHYNQIVIASGTARLLNMLTILLRNRVSNFAYEVPGYKKAASVFNEAGYDLIEIPLIESQVDVELLEKNNVDLLYVSPSHQYPTGTVMPYNNRISLLNWAKESNKLIIEDDYNSILRYDVNPISSMQGLSNNNEVIYFGSFSSLLLPSIRISYMILPVDLVTLFEQHKNKFTQGVSVLEQLTLANFMKTGSFDKHLRKLKKIQKRKNERIVDAISKYPFVEIVSASGGLNILFNVKDHIEQVKQNALDLKIKIEEITVGSILLNYSGISYENIENVMTNLFKVEDLI